MTARRHVALVLLTLLAPLPLARAQDAPPSQAPAARAELRGRVVTAVAHGPIARATVDVAPAGGGASVARAISDGDGGFRVPALRTGRYRVHIRALGYAPRDLPIVTVASAADVDVGAVALAAVAVKMQRVVVSERQREVQLDPDRNVYVVQDMPTTRGGTAIDVLRNVPSVDVDIDNVVSLRGSSGVIVQINGRPSPMKAEQLGNFLEQLPADMVAKVEVIPNPSARDDPEGTSGIINIVLRRETDAGLGGGVTLSGSTTGRAHVGGNLGWQRGPLSMYGSYGFMRDSRPRRDSIYRENLYLEPTTYLLEAGERTQEPLAHTVTGSAGYQLGEHDETSLDLMYSTRRSSERGSILYRNLDAARALTSLDDRVSAGTEHEFNFEGTLAYKHTFDSKRHVLTGELRTFRGREGGPRELVMRTMSSDGTPQGAADREWQLGYERPDESALKVDYSWPITDVLRFETGYKGSLQRFHTTLDTRLLDTAQGAYVPDTTRTSDFTYDQLVHGAYGMLNAVVGKFAMQGGVRLERASTQFHLNARNATYDNAYASVFPGALVAFNPNETYQVKLSYSTRIRRPDDADLIDPTLHYQDPLNVSRGNPSLKPEYIRAFELGLQRSSDRLTLQVTPFYRHTLDDVRSLRSIDSAGVATRTFANVATSDSYGTDATVALHGGRLSGFAGASAFRQVSNASNLDPTLSTRTFGWMARTNLSYRASKSLALQSLLFYRAPRTVEQGRIDSRVRFSLAARQKLMGDQLSLTLRLIDPFDASAQRSTTTDPRFYQVSERRRLERGVLLSVNWTFGRAPEVRRDDDEDRGEDGEGPVAE